MNVKGTKKKNQVVTANIFEQQELWKKAEVIKENLIASIWRELETNGKFDKNEKLSFISDDMLILGCDVGSETHCMRAIDTRGRELSKSVFPFNNDYEGFQSAKEWAVKIAAEHEKSQIVLGLEPTGHYWFCLATWMISNGISVVQVNPYAVKQTKEVKDNSQLKDDRKDPKLIANLVKDGNFGMPYLPEKLYAELRRLSMFRDQLNEDRIRTINRMHREMKIYFPEYKDALGKVDGAFSLELLKQAPFPDDLIALGEDGIRKIWHEAKLRGRGYSRAGEILQYAKASVGMLDMDDRIKKFVPNYPLNIIDIGHDYGLSFNNKELNELKNILQMVYSNCADNVTDEINSNVVSLAGILLNDNALYLSAKKGGKIKMCEALKKRDMHIFAEKDAEIAEKNAEIAEKEAELAEKEAELLALKAKLP